MEFGPRFKSFFGRSYKGPLSKEDLGALRQTAFHLWLFNVAAGMLVTGSQLQFVPEDGSLKVWIYATLALISTVALLSVPVGIIALLSIKPLTRLGIVRLVHGVMWTLFLVLLFVDKSIYNLFRYHFSSQVWDLFYTRGAEDAVHLGWQVWTAIMTGWFLASGAQMWIWNKIMARSRRDPESLPLLFLRPGMLWCGVIISAFFLEKMIYAQADLKRDKEVIELSKLFPLYPRLPISEWASDWGVEVTERAERLTFDSLKLNYPLEKPTVKPDGPRPNILILAIDCWRADMLNPTNTPKLAEYATDARVFQDHISTGNATRFGVFGMLYGLFGPYWFPVLRENRSPVLVDTLLDLDYDIEIFSSASANYPELRATAWSRFPERVHDDYGGVEPWRKDQLSTKDCADWWQRRKDAGDERPFFTFVLLDSPHQKYSYPPENAPFQPAADDLNYLFMSARGKGPEPEERIAIRNRYLNSVLHADEVAANLLAKLDELELDDNTIVIVTGDHGEEFWETGLFGHTSSFSPEQLRVPLIMRGPGIQKGVETSSTSHIDLPATILELLGADPTQRYQWTLGNNLLESHSPNRQRVVSGWDKLALWVKDGILEVPLHNEFTAFDILLYSYEWQLINDDEEIIKRHARSLRRLAEGCNRFRMSPPPNAPSSFK